MRKLRGGTSVGGMGSSGTGGLDDCAGGTNPQHTALGLMHLKKLFSEYTHPLHPLSDTERDDKLYNMLPLFCKVEHKSGLLNHSPYKVLFFLRLAQVFRYKKTVSHCRNYKETVSCC